MTGIDNPYENLTGGQWLRGNLHAHTSRSDGERATPEVIADYAKRGYDFLMLSDHDIYTSPEDLSRLENHGMVLIPGNEITARGPHLLHVNPSRLIAADPRRQAALNEIAADAQSFAIVAHPNWLEAFDYTTIAQLREWVGYAGIEIYNGVIGRLPGSPYATNKWDMLLSQGRRIWGYANDDSHAAVGDVGLGWTRVYARTKTLPDILDALRRGRFYASTGVTIREIEVQGRVIRVETENAERIVALQQGGQRFAHTDAKSIRVEIPEKAKYVRFECWGRGEQFAWTQPVFTDAK